MTVSHSAQMLLKLEKCIPSPVTLETVPKYANIERPTSSQLYASGWPNPDKQYLARLEHPVDLNRISTNGSLLSSISTHLQLYMDFNGKNNIWKMGTLMIRVGCYSYGFVLRRSSSNARSRDRGAFHGKGAFFGTTQPAVKMWIYKLIQTAIFFVQTGGRQPFRHEPFFIFSG